MQLRVCVLFVCICLLMRFLNNWQQYLFLELVKVLSIDYCYMIDHCVKWPIVSFKFVWSVTFFWTQFFLYDHCRNPAASSSDIIHSMHLCITCITVYLSCVHSLLMHFSVAKIGFWLITVNAYVCMLSCLTHLLSCMGYFASANIIIKTSSRYH